MRSSIGRLRRVLVIDDSEADWGIVRELIHTEASGQIILMRQEDLPSTPETISRLNPDVVLLDLNLRSSRGISTLESFKRVCPGVPLIVLTGDDQEATIREAIALGAQDFFEKDQMHRLPLLRLIDFAIERFMTQRRLESFYEQIQSQRSQLRLILENARDGILALDANETLVFGNDAALSMLGLERERAIGQPLFLPSSSPSDVLELPFSKGGTGSRYLEVVRTETTGEHPLRLIFLHDITQRRIFERKLLENERQNVVDKMASSLAHEFNNSLAITRMTTERLLTRPLEEAERKEQLTIMLEEIKRSLSLVNQMMGLSREVDVKPVAMDLKRFFDRNRRLYEKSLGDLITLNIEVSEETPIVRADPNALHQVLINLLINARHAMEPRPGKVTIRALVLSRLAPDDVCLEVEDEGCGIPPELLKTVFEPFFTTKPQGTGTGLGLAIVESLVRRMNARISLESTVGKGTLFRIWITQNRDSMNEPNVGPTGGRPAALKIAVVDDNPMLCTLLSDMLGVLGHEALASYSAEEALEHITSGFRPDVVITDWMMPGMNGLELIRRLNERLPTTSCILITGHVLPKDMGFEKLKIKCTVMRKPFNALELNAALTRVLS